MRPNATTRRDFVRNAAIGAGAAVLAHSFGQDVLGGAPLKRPRHILFLMCDQLRPDALGRYGDPYARTPALDALAASGMSFRQAYTQNPVCVPARNSILMGRYCHSTGALTNGHRSRRDLVTIPQYLRSKGWKTACFGKLHVKGRNDLDWDVLQEEKHKKGAMADDAEILPTGFSGGKHALGAPSPLSEQDTPEWAAKDDIIAFMKANRDTPWFIQCSMYKPHPPFQPPKRYWDAIDRSKFEIPRYPDDDLKDTHPRHWEDMKRRGLADLTDDQVRDAMQGYYGNLAFADAMIGEVLKALDDLGLRDDTLVVFTADHGEMLYHHRLWTKYTFFDPSVRVPMILSLPGRIPAGKDASALVEHVDLFPTLMELAGFDTPQSVQGKSFVPVLTGAKDTHHDKVFSEHYFKWNGKPSSAQMIFDGRYKFIDNGPGVPPELYDRKTDPREITNIQNQPGQRERLKALSAELKQWAARDIVETVGRAGEDKGGAKGKKGGAKAVKKVKG